MSWEEVQTKTSNVYNIPNDKKLYESLGLRPCDVARAAACFKKIDGDLNGTINLSELHDYLDGTETMYVKRLFSIFDEDYSGKISFREFLIGCWNYCTMGEISLPIFCFDLYDHDCSGEVELKEILIMMSEIYGQSFETNASVKQMLEELTVEAKKKYKNNTVADICLRINEFEGFCRRHPLLLRPAFLVQADLRKKICGNRFWESCSRRRVTLANGTAANAADFLKQQVQYQAFQDIQGKKPAATRVSRRPSVNNKGGPPDPVTLDQGMLSNSGTISSRRKSKQIEPMKAFKTPTIVRRAVHKLTGTLSPIVSPASRRRVARRGETRSSKRSGETSSSKRTGERRSSKRLSSPKVHVQ
jgi:Ca2+-binding EF-hand superfamily protein